MNAEIKTFRGSSKRAAEATSAVAKAGCVGTAGNGQPSSERVTVNHEAAGASPAPPGSILRETVGRQYNTIRFAVHSRKVGSEIWYGASRYKTELEAVEAIAKVGGRFHNVGCITIDMGASNDLYEYRIVRVESSCTVLQTSFVKL